MHAVPATIFVRGKILFLILATIACGSLAVVAQSTTTISGVVKGASGEPIAGAYVKVRNPDAGLTFMVVSQAQGRYSTPDIKPGKYTVQAIGADHQSPLSAPVDVASGKQATVDVTLSDARKMPAPRVSLTEADFEKQMPEGEAKKLLTTRCVLCHGMDRVVASRFTREEWEKTVDTMRDYMADHKITISDKERATMLDYLNANFNNSGEQRSRSGRAEEKDPFANLPATLAKGGEAKYVAMEFALKKKAGHHDITVDSTGTAWAGARQGWIAKFDPKTFTYTEIPVPPGKFKEAALNAIQADPKDVLWTMDNGPNNRMIAYNVKSREFNQFSIPAPAASNGSQINTIRFFKDGSVWGSGITSSRIIKLEPDTKKISDYPVPKGTHPYGMAIGGDGNIWYVANYADEIVKLEISSGKLTHYKVPPHTPRGPYGADVRRMGADHEGNLWAGENAAGRLLKIEYKTGKMTEYATPTTDSGPYSVDVPPKEDLIWFSEQLVDKLARFDPKTNAFLEFPLAGTESDVRRIEIDRSHPTRVWWSGADKLGYVEMVQ
jgi:virginiamycin B lyase